MAQGLCSPNFPTPEIVRSGKVPLTGSFPKLYDVSCMLPSLVSFVLQVMVGSNHSQWPLVVQVLREMPDMHSASRT